MLDKVKELIKISLSYYDKNNEKYSSLYDKFKYYSITPSTNDTEHSIIKFYDKNDDVVYESKYEILSFYDNSNHLWVWGWAIPLLRKNEVYLSRKILNYGLDLSLSEEIFLKSELITSRIIISDPIQISIHSSIASYISKTPMIIQLTRDKTEMSKEGLNIIDKQQLLKKMTPTTISWIIYLLDEPQNKSG